jgi:pimeloyl-ACP methyl ester carboxylesterase
MMITGTFAAPDGVDLAYHETGEGRPVVLLHGYITAALDTWVAIGLAGGLAALGRRVIMPDMRGHGKSAKPHDPAAWPPGVLTTDAFALVDHLALSDYDLAGYSLGARTIARMLALGATPKRAIIAGTGLEPITHATSRGENYRHILSNLGTFEAGSPEAQVEQWIRNSGSDPVALLGVLDSFIDTPIEALGKITVPTLVLAGDEERGRGSIDALAAAIPGSRLQWLPGDHIEALLSPQLRDAFLEFLA